MPTTPLSELLNEGPARTSEYTVVHAEVVYDGIGLPRHDGAVLFKRYPVGDPLIADVRDKEGTLKVFSEAHTINAGFAISPPVVNAHTHLDLTTLPHQEGDYLEFMARVISHGRAGERGLSAAQQGLKELREAGTSVIGDMVTDPAVMELLLSTEGLEGVAYWEVIDPHPESAEESFREAANTINRFRALERPGGMRVGVSPNASFTVSADLMRYLTTWAHQESLPVAIHVAESREEVELFMHGTGPLAEWLGDLGVNVPARGVSPVNYLAELGALGGAPTLIHGVQVNEEDARLISRADSVVVHCPRSNEALSVGKFPWTLYAKHSVDVAFGTGPRALSSDLDVTEEVLAAMRLHGDAANARALVRAAVKGGYRALGMKPVQALRGATGAKLVAWH